MFFLRFVAKSLTDESRGGAIGLCWADVASIDDARFAADAMAADGGWAIESVEEASEVAIDEFDDTGREFFRRAELQGAYMAMYTWPAEAPVRRGLV